MRRWIEPTLSLLALSALLPGCKDEPPPQDVTVLPGPTKGGSIQVSPDESRLAVVNSGTGELTIFTLPGLQEESRLRLGGEPESVAFSPKGDRLYVVQREQGTVVRVSGVGTAAPKVDATVDVGSEPGRAALSPTGAHLWVPLWSEGHVVAVDTETMTVDREIATGGRPYAACITNDLDREDDDETIFVTDFYGVPRAGAREGTDAAREGRVFIIDAADGDTSEVRLPALARAGTEGFETTGAYPNQLYACAINEGTLYVTSVGASPAAFDGTTDFRQNLQGLVHRVTIGSRRVDPRVVDLNGLVDALPAPKRFASIPVDIAFVPNSELGYIASLASDSVLRVDFSVSPPRAGSPSGATFLATSASPMGVAIAGTDLFTNNEVGRSISRVDLRRQVTVAAAIESASPPRTMDEVAELQGQRFFNTGLGRWSTNGWVSCAGCHPFGTTDNVTWSFPAGPRQTSDTSATFDDGATQQRILNWTAIFDEIHDFELNTRGVAGGTGAIVNDPSLRADGTANTDAQIDIVGPGGLANPRNAFNLGSARGAALTGARPADWDAIAAYVASLRSPHGSTRLEGDPVIGRVMFEVGGCNTCHAGSLWTLSRRTYDPAFNLGDGTDRDERTVTFADLGITSLGEVREDQVPSLDPAVLTVLADDASGPPARHTCVSRIVGTFGVDGPRDRGAVEVRQNGAVAQGIDGYNVPSLLGVGLGAPYLHNGAAETLEELLDPSGEFLAHLRAGNQVFSPTREQLADLIAFVASIDDRTEPFPIMPAQDFCPPDVPQRQ
jgi:cytochrome c peroxidase